ncbi:hypothetical protein B0H12DRAFT_1221557 [Mycena haematopus]|nr:hypothetical protein B0H12DRAFT_1221557 [Mycena haematopus]
MASAAIFCFTVLAACAGAVLTNVTIDDSNLSYFTWTEAPGIEPVPAFPWAAIAPGDPCLYCSAQPPTTDIHDQTWHDGSNNSAGSFTFQVEIGLATRICILTCKTKAEDGFGVITGGISDCIANKFTSNQAQAS